MTSAPVNTTSALLLGGAALLCACPAAPVKPTSRPAVPIEEAKKEPLGQIEETPKQQDETPAPIEGVQDAVENGSAQDDNQEEQGGNES